MSRYYLLLWSLIVTGIFLGTPLLAQYQYNKHNIFKVWVNAESNHSEPGYLYRLGDSSLFLAKNLIIDGTQLTEYQIPNIYSLKIRPKGNIGTGILLGAAAGFLVNGVVDLLRQRPTESACSVCPLLAEIQTKKGPNRRRYLGSVVMGGLVGGLIGSIKVNISLGGSYDRYQYHKKELERYRFYR